MQRFFAFTDEARLTKINNMTLQVDYQGITDNTIAQQIRLVRLRFKLIGGPIIVYDVAPSAVSVEFIQTGQALIHLAPRWEGSYEGYKKVESGNFAIEEGKKRFNAYQINNIYAKVCIPRYKDASKTVEAELHFEE